jgi:hypothetical protein
MKLFSKLLSLAISVCCTLASCYARPRLTPLVPTDTPLANYSIGELRKTAPGGILVERIEGAAILPGYVPNGPIQVKSIGEQPPPARDVWAAHYRYEGKCQNGSYLVTHPGFYAGTIGIVVAADGTVPCDKAVVQIAGSKAGRSWSLTRLKAGNEFSPKPFIAQSGPASVRWQLLYGGRSGNELLLDYREFVNLGSTSEARPAFFQQIKYDVGASKLINFRETQIEVVASSNNEISFRVLRDKRKAIRTPELWDGTPNP